MHLLLESTTSSDKSLESNSILVFATTHGHVSLLDLNGSEIKRTMSQPVHLGPITCLCIDQQRSWLVTGTLKGYLTLWDIRFGILIRSWQVNLSGGKISQCSVDPLRGQGSWVLVAVSGENADGLFSRECVIEVWDVEKIILVKTYISRPDSQPQPISPKLKPSSSGSRGTEVNPKGSAAEAIALLLQAQQNEKTPTSDQSMILESPFLHPENDTTFFTHTISCFLAGINFYGPGYIAGTEGLEIYIGADDFAMPSVTQDTGYLLTGSRDCRIRFWDLNRTEKTRIICGAGVEDDKPVFQ